MAPRWTAVLICGCLLSFCSGSGQTSDIDDCDDKQRHKNHIELCHNRSLPSSSDAEICQCKDDNQGFIVNDLLIARSSKEHRCDSFQADGFLGVQCLRGKVDSVTQLDAAVFDVLEKVSGKNQIKKYTEVQHISFTATGEGGEKEEDSSAFVSFQKICKPVRPADTKVVEMCTKGKTTGHSVFLVLNRSRVPSAASRCRCKLTPSKALDVKALDIRLQHFASHVCQPGVSLKMSVDGQTVKDLKCEGLYAYYSLEKLHSGEEEVVLELTVRADAFPTALWMQVEERLEDGGNTVIVSCEDIAPVDVDGGDENGEEQEEDKGMGLGGILGIIIAGIIVSGIRGRRCHNLH
ncbi:uncharacterized protein LOC143298320 [Babylonia areolata]|uniref:uncharacterized protein LOC143298320 n=1 Tax=Babylonia areolata TaxID=304850 RepID=UPI003FD53763